MKLTSQSLQIGPMGSQGVPGATGPTGPTGPSGALLVQTRVTGAGEGDLAIPILTNARIIELMLMLIGPAITGAAFDLLDQDANALLFGASDPGLTTMYRFTIQQPAVGTPLLMMVSTDSAANVALVGGTMSAPVTGLTLHWRIGFPPDVGSLIAAWSTS